MATNHWSVSIGSITTPVRSPRGTISLCGLTRSSRPCASRSATMALRASKRSMPRYFSGPCSLMRASSVRTLIGARPWRWPTCQSLKSWAGVILTQPVPNSLST
jgi:hypothetical protein